MVSFGFVDFLTSLGEQLDQHWFVCFLLSIPSYYSSFGLGNYSQLSRSWIESFHSLRVQLWPNSCDWFLKDFGRKPNDSQAIWDYLASDSTTRSMFLAGDVHKIGCIHNGIHLPFHWWFFFVHQSNPLLGPRSTERLELVKINGTLLIESFKSYHVHIDIYF